MRDDHVDPVDVSNIDQTEERLARALLLIVRGGGSPAVALHRTGGERSHDRLTTETRKAPGGER